MDPFKLIEKVGAELACNTAILNVQGKRTIIARFVGNQLTLTEEGETLVRELENAAEKPKSRTKAKAKAKPDPEPEQGELDLDEALRDLDEEA